MFNSEKFGKAIAFIMMYFIFTTIFYFLLKFINKFPDNWNYFHIANITLFLILIGFLLKFLLK